MKKEKGKDILENLESLKILPNKANKNLKKEIDKHLKESIKKSKKIIENNKKFKSLNITNEYLYIKIRLYSERRSVLKPAMPL